LDEIAALLNGAADRQERLRTQRQLLRERISRLQAVVAAIDRELEATQMGITLKPEERFEVFGGFVPEDYEAEAQERWGGSPAYAESQRRVARCTKDDWLRLKNEATDLGGHLADAMRAGVPAASTEAMDLAEQHRQHITRWFYECSYGIHCGLGEMYVADPRFARRYDAQAPGLASYLRDAILANARRAGA